MPILLEHNQDLRILNLQIPLEHTQDFHVIQYADNTLIIAKGDTRQLFFLKPLLNTFSMSTGLKVNFQKTMMVPINISKERLEVLFRTFECGKGSLPFTYLGLLLSLTKPRAQNFVPLINGCEKRISRGVFIPELGWKT